MNLKLNKKKMKSLSADFNSIPAEVTPKVAGGVEYPGYSNGCGATRDIQCNINSVKFCNPK